MTGCVTTVADTVQTFPVTLVGGGAVYGGGRTVSTVQRMNMALAWLWRWGLQVIYVPMASTC